MEDEYTVATMDAITAMPSAATTWRTVFCTADPAPDLRRRHGQGHPGGAGGHHIAQAEAEEEEDDEDQPQRGLGLAAG